MDRRKGGKDAGGKNDEGELPGEFSAQAYRRTWSILAGLFGDVLPSASDAGPAPPAVIPQPDDCDTPFAVGPASAAVWEAVRALSRHHQSASRRVDPDLAVLSLRQERHLQVDGERAQLWDGFSGVYECGDGGLVQLHCNFAHHREAALEALRSLSGSPARARDKAEALDQARRIRASDDLANRTMNLGGATAVVRPLEHKPPSELGPLVDIAFQPASSSAQHRDQGGDDACARPAVRVIDLTRVLAGPVGTHILSEAVYSDVLTVSSRELPQVEPARLLFSRGKRSAFCDFRVAKDLEAFKNLLRDADVVVQSYREGSLDKFGLEELRTGRAADLGSRGSKVFVNIRAYSDKRDLRGYDSLVQCHSGMFDAHSRWVGRREHLPVQALDHLTGMLAALSALACLKRIRQGQTGTYVVNLSLERTARLLIDELPLRAQRTPGGLERIEKRVLNEKGGFVTSRTPSGRTIGFLKSVLADCVEGDNCVQEGAFVETAGVHDLAWL